MKILHLITRSDWAGAQKILFTIVKGIKNNYSEKIIIEVATGTEGPMVNYLQNIGIHVHIIPDIVHSINPGKDIKAFLSIRKLLDHGKYDILHLHSSKAATLGAIAAKTVCKKVVSVRTLHGFWPQCPEYGIKGSLFLQIEKVVASLLDQLVFVCEKDLKKAEKWNVGRKDRHSLVYNAIEPPEPCRGKLRKELNIDKGIKIIGNVARFDKPKNPFIFLDVAKKVLRQKQDVEFVWIGDSTQNTIIRKDLVKMVDHQPLLKNKVHFIGFRENAANLMSDFDILLFTSDSEGMPLVILEAQAHGIPIASTDVGGIAEIIGPYGITTSINDREQCTDELTDYILKTLLLPHTRHTCPNTQPANIMTQKYMDLYSELYNNIS